MDWAVKAEDLNVNYGRVSVLWDLSFEIPKGVLLGLIGPNGAGKSTLLQAMLSLIKPFSGKVESNGKVAYVPQRKSVDWDFPITVLEVVLMGRFKRKLFQGLKKADYQAAELALEQVGLKGLAKRQISELSGGQQQRLFFARALIQEADLLLLDEPFAGVDLTTEKAMMDLLKEEVKKGKTIIMVHHDLFSVRSYFDWVLLLNHRLHGCGPVEEIFQEERILKTFGKNPSLFEEAAFFSIKTRRGER